MTSWEASIAEDFLRWVVPASKTVELRTLGDRKLSGRFNDLAVMAQATDRLQRHSLTNVYFTINTVRPEATHVGHSQINTIGRAIRTTGDQDVLARSLYLIDVDPERDSGTSATDREKMEAIAVSDKVREFLGERGWPEPLVVDSGNGQHLYLRGDMCAPISPTWVRVLQGLSQRFGTETAKVDSSVGNASRISRLPGTWNRKGNSTPDRPHRLCQVVEYPRRWDPLAEELIRQLADELHPEPVRKPPRSVTFSHHAIPVKGIEERIHEFAAEYSDFFSIERVFQRRGCRLFALSACPFVGRAHTGDRGKTCITLQGGWVGFKCFAGGCTGRTFRGLRQYLQDISGRRSNVRFYDTAQFWAA